MEKKEKFGAFRLKQSTIDYLQSLKQAFELSYEKDFTNDEFIKKLAASVEEGDVAVWEIFCTIEEQKEALAAKAEEVRANHSN